MRVKSDYTLLTHEKRLNYSCMIVPLVKTHEVGPSSRLNKGDTHRGAQF